MRRVLGLTVRRRMSRLDPMVDADEIARLSLVTLHGRSPIVYALFTVAFLKQVAVPDMARTLHRRGTGDIVRATLRRNDDTIVFFGNLLDHGPGSETGRAWIARLNHIHSHFPLRNQDMLYTLSTLALDPHDITSTLGESPFGPTELEAHWRFWRAVALGQHVEDLPTSREEIAAWAADFERREFAPTDDGRRIAEALVRAFGERCLPRAVRHLDAKIISSLCPPRLREVHDLPEPSAMVSAVVRLAFAAYAKTLPIHLVPVERSLAFDFGESRYGPRPIEAVGYRRPSTPGG